MTNARWNNLVWFAAGFLLGLVFALAGGQVILSFFLGEQGRQMEKMLGR